MAIWRLRIKDWISGIKNAEYVDMDTLLSSSHFISIHVPLLPQTHHLIDKASITLIGEPFFLKAAVALSMEYLTMERNTEECRKWNEMSTLHTYIKDYIKEIRQILKKRLITSGSIFQDEEWGRPGEHQPWRDSSPPLTHWGSQVNAHRVLHNVLLGLSKMEDQWVWHFKTYPEANPMYRYFVVFCCGYPGRYLDLNTRLIVQ